MSFLVNNNRVSFDPQKQKVYVEAPDSSYWIGESGVTWTVGTVLDYLLGRQAGWNAKWTTDVDIEDMLDTKISDVVAMEALGNLQIL